MGRGVPGKRYLAPIGDSQFRFLFARHQRKSSGILRDASIAWASCSRTVNDPSKPAYAPILTRTTAYGVMTIDEPKIMKFSKPCSEDKTHVLPTNTAATFGDPSLKINRNRR